VSTHISDQIILASTGDPDRAVNTASHYGKYVLLSHCPVKRSLRFNKKMFHRGWLMISSSAKHRYEVTHVVDRARRYVTIHHVPVVAIHDSSSAMVYRKR
jgi:hypothetical protein